MRMDGNTIVYEKGDYITALNGSGGGYKKGNVYRVKADQESSNHYVHTVIDERRNTDNAWGANNFRPSSQDEINKATQEEKIMVGANTVTFYPHVKDCSHIEVGCESVTKELFLKIGKKAKWL